MAGRREDLESAGWGVVAITTDVVWEGLAVVVGTRECSDDVAGEGLMVVGTRECSDDVGLSVVGMRECTDDVVWEGLSVVGTRECSDDVVWEVVGGKGDAGNVVLEDLPVRVRGAFEKGIERLATGSLLLSPSL